MRGGVVFPQILPAEQWPAELATRRAMHGITHVCAHTVGLGLKAPAEHVRSLARVKKDLLS